MDPWNFLNSPFCLLIIATVFIRGIIILYQDKPQWSDFEGTIISAVKFAEKITPFNNDAPSITKLDAALKYTLKVYEQTKNRHPSKKTISSFKEGIQIVHRRLEEAGLLNKA